jgi:hypothetical protein
MMPADAPTIRAHALLRFETFITKTDEFIILQFETSDEDNPKYFVRLHRADFISLAEYLANDARRMQQ